MTTFTDTEGRSWTVQVTVDAIRRVRDLTGVNLAVEATGGDLFERLAADPVLLCDILYGLVKPEADKASVSDEDFGRAMAGDAIDCATEALLEELVAFFPQSQRQVLKKALAKLEKFEVRAVEFAMRRLDDPALDAKFEAALEKVGDSSGGLLESSGSTLVH